MYSPGCTDCTVVVPQLHPRCWLQLISLKGTSTGMQPAVPFSNEQLNSSISRNFGLEVSDVATLPSVRQHNVIPNRVPNRLRVPGSAPLCRNSERKHTPIASLPSSSTFKINRSGTVPSPPRLHCLHHQRYHRRHKCYQANDREGLSSQNRIVMPSMLFRPPLPFGDRPDFGKVPFDPCSSLCTGRGVCPSTNAGSDGIHTRLQPRQHIPSTLLSRRR